MGTYWQQMDKILGKYITLITWNFEMPETHEDANDCPSRNPEEGMKEQ